MQKKLEENERVKEEKIREIKQRDEEDRVEGEDWQVID